MFILHSLVCFVSVLFYYVCYVVQEVDGLGLINLLMLNELFILNYHDMFEWPHLVVGHLYT